MISRGITYSPQGIAGNVSSKWAKGTGGPAGDECYNLVAFLPTQDPISSEDGLTHAPGTGESGGCATAAVAFTKSKRAQSVADDETWIPGQIAPTQNQFDQGDTRATTVVAFDTYNQTLRAGSSEPDHEKIGAVWSGMSVRRLTPRECERLQGFPYDYTLVTYRNKPATDGPRYRAIGNSMAVPCMWWLGHRINRSLD